MPKNKKTIGFGSAAGIKGLSAVQDSVMSKDFFEVSVDTIKYNPENKREAEGFIERNFEALFPSVYDPKKHTIQEYIKSVNLDILSDSDPISPEALLNAVKNLCSLAHSIATETLLQPVGVEDSDNGWLLSFGHRRFLAHKILGMSRIKTHRLSSGMSRLEKLMKRRDENKENLEIPLIGRIEEYKDLKEELERSTGESNFSHSELGRRLNYDHRIVSNYTKGVELLSNENTASSVRRFLENANEFALTKLVRAVGDKDLNKINIDSIVAEITNNSNTSPKPPAKKKKGRAANHIKFHVKNIELARDMLEVLKRYDTKNEIQISPNEVEDFNDLKFIESIIKKL